MTCPFKWQNTFCKIQVSHIQKNNFGEGYFIMYDLCMGEKNCPVPEKDAD